jgi:hypothetical protein
MKPSMRTVLGTVIGILGLCGTVWGQTADVLPAKPQPPTEPQVQPQAPVDPEHAPRLTFETMEHDWGRITDEGEAEAQFRFTNTGKGVLHFTTPFRASCGCTAGNPRSDKNPEFDQVDFAPGESGFIKVAVKLQGKHGDMNQQVTVVSNDPVAPEQILKVHGFVRQIISIDPPLLSFGEVLTGTPSTQVVKITGPAPAFKATYASISKGKYFSVRVADTREIEEGGEKLNQSTLEVTYNGQAPRGDLSALALIRTSHDKYPLKDYQVTAVVVGDVQVLPPRLNVGILDTAIPFTKVFRVSSRTGKPFKITRIDQTSSLSGPLVVTYSPVEPGNETAYQVEVKGVSPATVTPISATLTLLTDAPSDPRIEVQLSGAVRAPLPPQPAVDHFTPGAPPGQPPAPSEKPIETAPPKSPG